MHHLIGESYVHGLMDGEGYAEFFIGNEEGRHTFVLMVRTVMNTA